ncbi:ABC transporter ATP-binding protein [Facklamia sp. P12934]|uniref:ABC transporter ATP-binding protein n=1 Tax=unclassified Facklamia TaxID=2622293 RepID=UPI003D173784
MIQVTHLHKNFGQRSLFADLNLNFEAGTSYALTGQSGSGKTTLLNMIAHLEVYDQGQILFKGQDLKSIKDFVFFRDYLGYLFQNFGLIENETVEANLALGLIGKKLSKPDKKTRMHEILDQVGLNYLKLDRKVFELSGGEAQRVALAKVILKDPPLILADEPTASIDNENAKAIMKKLLSLSNDNRVILIATHDPLVWEMVDQVVDLNILNQVH